MRERILITIILLLLSVILIVSGSAQTLNPNYKTVTVDSIKLRIGNKWISINTFWTKTQIDSAIQANMGASLKAGNGIYIKNDTINQRSVYKIKKDSAWSIVCDNPNVGQFFAVNVGDTSGYGGFGFGVTSLNGDFLETGINTDVDGALHAQYIKNGSAKSSVKFDSLGLRIDYPYPSASTWDANNFITKGYGDTAYSSTTIDTTSLSNRIDSKLNIVDSITKYKTPTQFKNDTVKIDNTGTVTKDMFNRWEAKQNALGFTPLNILDTVDRTKVATRKVLDSLLAIYNGTYIDINNYGAVNDSVTDNYQAFTDAIAACPYNGSVLIPPGNFKVAKRIHVNKKITFLGLGGQIIFSMDSALFRIRSNNVSFSNLKIRGDGNVSKTNQIAIYDSSYLNITVEKCDFTNIGGSTIYSTNIFTNPGLSVIGGVIEGGGNGVFFDTRGEYSSVTGTLIRTAQKGVRVKAGNIILKGLNVVGCVDGITIEPGTNGAHGIIDGCQSNHNSGYALKIDSATLGETVSDCHFYDGGVYVKNSKSVKFNNCYFEPDYLRFENSTECMVSKCTFDAGLGMSTIETSYNNQPSIVYFEGNVGGQTTIPRQEFGYQNDYKAAQSGTTLDLGLAKRQYRSLSANVTITSLTNAKKGKYFVEILGNGYTWELIDNTRYSGKYDKNKLNIFEIDVTNESPNLNWTASISQPTIIRDTTQRNVTFIYPNRSVITVPIASNTITKGAGSSSNWDGYASCTETLLGNGTIQAKWTVSQLNSMFGFSTNPLASNINNMRYGIYFSGTNVYKCENGTVSGVLTTAAANNLFRVRVIGTSVIYQKSTDNGANWTTISTAAQAAVFPLKVMVIIRGLNDAINDVKIHGWCGNYFDLLTYPSTQQDTAKLNIKTSSKYIMIAGTSSNKYAMDSLGYIYNTKPHAWGQFSDSSVVISLTQNNWVHLTNATKTLFPITDYYNVIDLSDTLKIQYAGDVNCDFSISFNATITDNYEFRIVKNGTQICKFHFDCPASSNEFSIAIPSAMHVSKNDKVWLEVRNTANNNDITIIAGSIRLRYDYLDINQ